MINNFFVYGTLKVGGYFAYAFDGVRESSHSASLEGFDLFRVQGHGNGGFPGISPGKGIVLGELHKFSDKELPAVMRMMDRIEGYNEKDEKGSLYIRKTMPVTNVEDGYTEMAHLYVFNGSTKALDKISSGVWEI